MLPLALPADTRNVIPLPLAGGRPPLDGADLVGWALAAVAESERRLRNLQERVNLLESLSMSDELTGTLNRRGFMAELGRAAAAAQRRTGPGGVVLLGDLDGFKAINDVHGHEAGDRALRVVAATLRMHLRRTDALARLGGDEFAVLLCGAALDGGRRKARELTAAIAGMKLGAAGESPPLGISFGAAALAPQLDEDAVLRRADRAMYRAKRRRKARLAAICAAAQGPAGCEAP